MPQIEQNYIDEGLVYYVFKDFPLTNIHPQAVLAAEAARCAGDQGAYVAMHDQLFAQQQTWSGRDDAAALFADYAAELDLDVAAFTACLESDQHEAAVQADLEQGVELGVRGTPAFFVNGRFLNGAQPYNTFEQAIERALSETE
jgi:protein-disulfide isomerase